MTIRCSVGILTYNSEKNLRRALESVKDFSDIIIADGGSTDSTLEIAAAYGCRVIDQYTKHHPGPDPHHPLADFARERNQLIEAAKEDWYLWIDSDEYISGELRKEIETICSEVTPRYFAYEIPIGTQSPDATVTYTQWKQAYQVRFFNLRSGGHFERPMHERYVFDRTKYPVGRLKGLWYVPLSKPDFTSYSRAVQYRINVMMAPHPPKTFWQYLIAAFFIPLKRCLSTLHRYTMTKLFVPAATAYPWYYFRNQLYSHYVTSRVAHRLYWEQR